LSKSPIQKREALSIAKKLGAFIDTDGAHQIAFAEYKGVTVITFGIRHGAKSAHGHLVGRYGDLRVNETKVLKLANCTMSKDEYFQELMKIGEIEDDTENTV
jgi:hypothetical protein